MRTNFHIGCAGWAIPSVSSAKFGVDGSQLQRYATKLNAVEVNSSFYRSHRTTTYARWADTTPSNFRFAVKMPRAITHDARLVRCGTVLDAFFVEIAALRHKLGCVLVQLPPGMNFETATVRRFLGMLRRRFDGPCVFEPRHATWFEGDGDKLLAEFDIGRVGADPPVTPAAANPGAYRGLTYYRLHGSPRTYCSDYSPEFLQRLAAKMLVASKQARDLWCIFDNTAQGYAPLNALGLSAALLSKKQR